MLEALLKLFASLATVSVIALQSITPLHTPSVSSAFEKESTELLIEETFIPLRCRFIANFYQGRNVSDIIEILKASGCIDYFEIHPKVKIIPLFGDQRGER